MWHLSFIASQSETETFCQELEALCVSVSWFEQDPSQHLWQGEALFEEKPEITHLSALLKGIKYEIAPLPSVNWLAENRKAFPPLDLEPFYIYGSHHAEDHIPPGRIAFKIDAATAFGTGRHGTTQGCLKALWALKKAGFMARTCLDLGCGTAVLAMASARLFQGRVIASDNDPEAVSRARLNIVDNHLEEDIEILLSEGFENSLLQERAPYDLIVANILAAPLIELAGEITQFTAPKGRVILSGLLQTQHQSVLKAYDAHHFSLETLYPLDEWVTLVLKRA